MFKGVKVVLNYNKIFISSYPLTVLSTDLLLN